ncbi:hypothetical protein P3T73_02505 [Kiritimatiellota bacterium B12222]|nr:hypothetical protein P3T73_02505 [Kiritimatiellota bacterium B12222]
MKSVELNRIDWGQLLDGLRCRVEQYEKTAKFYQTGKAESEILEVSDAEEAEAIANDYREIIKKIEGQLGT